ncbi:MAG: RND family transporter [Bauldia sp.]
MGLLARAHPRIAAIILGLLAVVAVYGLFHVAVDRDLRNMFRGESAAYETYLETAEAFADPENQVLVLVEGNLLDDPAALDRLRAFHIELQLLPDAGSVYSLFSLLTPPDAAGNAAPLVGDAATLTPALLADVREHPILGQSLVSAAGTEALFFVTHRTPRAPLAEQEELLAEVQAIASTALDGTGLQATVTGLAAVRAEIVHLLQRDQFVLNGAGIAVGFVLSFLFFRSVIASLMTALPAALAGLVLLGWNGALGVPITIITNVVPILVMVLGYADGMHLSSAWRRARDRGLSPAEAERVALLEAGPPCMLTALTMAIAFLSMTISNVELVRNFGWTGAIGTVIGTWIVLAGHALAGLTLGRLWKASTRTETTPLGWLSAPIKRLTAVVIRFAWPIAILSVPLTIVSTILFLAVPPDHSVRETLPRSSAAATALTVLDTRLGGVFPVQIVVPMGGAAPTSADGLTRVAAVHDAVAAVPGVRTTLSLASFARWLGDGTVDAEELRRVLDLLSPEVQGRLVGAPGAVVTANIPELTTAETLRLLDAIEAAATAAAPEAVLTGSSVLTAREATRTINRLSASLGLAVFAGLALIAIALRSVPIALVALIPNLLPDMATGSLLYFLGDGMQLTSVVALTIAFGIAVDDTIHYLNVVVRQRRGRTTRQRLIRASRDVGPVLVATTAVVVVGMFATLTSGLTTIVTFGLIVITSLVMALVGDLVFLPAIMAGPARRWFDRPASRDRQP